MVTVAPRSLKVALANKELLVGTWIKTPSHIIAEVLASTDLDVLCLDAEHAPFDRLALDSCVLACRSRFKSVLIRPPSSAPEHLLNALDLGSDGVIVPHVLNREGALDAIRHAHYGPAGRGYAGSTRAAGYASRSMADHLASSQSTVVIAQIEDRLGLDNAAEIAQCSQIDCIFIGRADLAVSMGKASPSDPEVLRASEDICRAARAAGRALGMFVPDLAEVSRWIELGVSLFLLESDHVFLRKGARALVDEVRKAGTARSYK